MGFRMIIHQYNIDMSTQTSQKEITIQGKLGMLITVRIINAAGNCIASTTEFLSYQR
jgi:hypothetical protein